MFRSARAVAEAACRGGQETISKGANVVYVEGMNPLLSSELLGSPFCGFEHVRGYAIRRGTELEAELKSPERDAAALESARKARRAWKDLEEAAGRAEFGRTRGTR